MFIPGDHAAREVADVGEAHADQELAEVARASAGAAHDEQARVARPVLRGVGDIALRQPGSALDAPVLTGPLVGLADVDDSVGREVGNLGRIHLLTAPDGLAFGSPQPMFAGTATLILLGMPSFSSFMMAMN